MFKEDSRGDHGVDPTYDDLPVIRYGDKSRTINQKSKINSQYGKPPVAKPAVSRPPQLTPKKLINATVAQYKPSSESQDHLKNLQVGMTVSHERFGNGKVVNIEGQFPNSKASVDFGEAGQKQLLLKFAKLEIVS